MSERATRTTLAVGAVSAPVALYRTFGDKFPETTFETAGPNGGKLWAVDAATVAVSYTHLTLPTNREV